jgi:hypothetical protein
MENNNKMVGNKTIGDLKKEAAQLAIAFGYNIHSPSLDVINVQDFYCMGYQKAVNEYDKLKEDNTLLLEQNSKLKRLLEGLTPGGSEFFNDPEYCAKWVKEQFDYITTMYKNLKKRHQ